MREVVFVSVLDIESHEMKRRQFHQNVQRTRPSAEIEGFKHKN